MEEEVLSKVEENYEQLKQIIDQQKENAKNIIRHLESVQNYKPPPQDFTDETFSSLQMFA